MNRGSAFREKLQLPTAPRAYIVRRTPGTSLRGDRVEEPPAGTAAKHSGTPKYLLKKLSKDPNVLSPTRTKTPEEKTIGQRTSANIRVPEKGKPAPKDLNQTTRRSDRGVSFSATPKAEVRGKASKVGKGNSDESKDGAQISSKAEEKLRTKITGAIINYIKSTPFKRQLSEHIVWEISVKISKAVAQYHEQQQVMRVCKAEAGVRRTSPARGCRRERSSKLGFSISVASLLGYELIESRDKMIEYFQRKSAGISDTESGAETEIVKTVFESILASVINVETLHPVEDIETYSPDSIIDGFESILQNSNPADGRSPFRESTFSADESSSSPTVSTPEDKSDVEPPFAEEVVPTKVDALKVENLGQQEQPDNQEQQEQQERTIFGPRKFMERLKHFLTPGASDQDQSSEVDVKDKDDAEDEIEVEKVQAADITGTQTTANERDLEPVEEAKDLVSLVESGVDLDQPTPSVEILPPEVDEEDLELSEQQKLASPVPSPAASEKPDPPREPPKTTTCPPEPTSYSPDLPVSIPETSDTKTTTVIQIEEDDLEPTLPLSYMENTTSSESEEKEEETKMLNPDVEAEERLADKPDVNLDQVSSTSSEESIPCEPTEQDLLLTGHRTRASPVPSPLSPEEPAPPREPATRSTRLSRRAGSLYSMKKGMKKGSVLISSTSRFKESRMLSKTFDMKKSVARKAVLPGYRKQQRAATAGDAANRSLKAPSAEPPLDSAPKTEDLPTTPEEIEEKTSEQGSGDELEPKSSIQEKPRAVSKKRIDFSKCCRSCTCDHQEQ